MCNQRPEVPRPPVLQLFVVFLMPSCAFSQPTTAPDRARVGRCSVGTIRIATCVASSTVHGHYAR